MLIGVCDTLGVRAPIHHRGANRQLECRRFSLSLCNCWSYKQGTKGSYLILFHFRLIFLKAPHRWGQVDVRCPCIKSAFFVYGIAIILATRPRVTASGSVYDPAGWRPSNVMARQPPIILVAKKYVLPFDVLSFRKHAFRPFMAPKTGIRGELPSADGRLWQRR